MSLTITIPTPRIRRRLHRWCETDAVALAVADVTSLHLTPSAVRAVVDETLHRHGGPEGVRVELDRRLASSAREAARAQRALEWARWVLTQVRHEARQATRR